MQQVGKCGQSAAWNGPLLGGQGAKSSVTTHVEGASSAHICWCHRALSLSVSDLLGRDWCPGGSGPLPRASLAQALGLLDLSRLAGSFWLTAALSRPSPSSMRLRPPGGLVCALAPLVHKGGERAPWAL